MASTSRHENGAGHVISFIVTVEEDDGLDVDRAAARLFNVLLLENVLATDNDKRTTSPER